MLIFPVVSPKQERTQLFSSFLCRTPCLHPHISIIPFPSPGIFYHLFLLLSDAGETESERREQLRQKRAEIARCWIKYCLNLLQDSKKLLEVLRSFTCQLMMCLFVNVAYLCVHLSELLFICPHSSVCLSSDLRVIVTWVCLCFSYMTVDACVSI